jgi:hypothetical protein
MCRIPDSCLPVVGPSDIAPTLRSQGNRLFLATNHVRLHVFHIEQVRRAVLPYDELCWLPHRGTTLRSVEYAKQSRDKGRFMRKRRRGHVRAPVIIILLIHLCFPRSQLRSGLCG